MDRSRLRTIWLVLLVGGAALLGVFLWRDAVRPNLFAKNFGVVEPGLIYRSGELSPESLRRVIQNNTIRTVIDLGTFEPGSSGERREQRVCDVLGVERFRMQLSGDSTGNPNYYVQALRLMSDPQRQPVLVHCGAGSERTGCAVILYRHVVQGRPVDEVYSEAIDHRHSDARNPRFRETLNQWTDKVAAAYREGGLIPGVDPVPEPLTPVAGAGRP